MVLAGTVDINREEEIYIPSLTFSRNFAPKRLKMVS